MRLWQAEEFRFSRQLIASALVLFFLLTVFCSFPFIADDYRFLAESYGPGFSLTSFNPFVERMPVSMLLNYVLFKFHVWEKTWAVLYVFFIAHVMGFALVFKWLQGRIRTESAAESRTPLPATATYSWPFLAFAVLLTLNPNFYEVFYWSSAAPYMFGYLILAGALYARSGLVKSILFATTLFVSEMFGPVLFCLVLAPYLLTGQSVRKFSVAYLKSTLPWWAGILLYGLIRVTLMQFLPAREYHVAFTLHNLAGQFMFYLRMLFEIQFIRLNWVSSILELLGLSVLLFAIKKERPFTLRNRRHCIFASYGFQSPQLPSYLRCAPRVLRHDFILGPTPLGFGTGFFHRQHPAEDEAFSSHPFWTLLPDWKLRGRSDQDQKF